MITRENEMNPATVNLCDEMVAWRRTVDKTLYNPDTGLGVRIQELATESKHTRRAVEEIKRTVRWQTRLLITNLASLAIALIALLMHYGGL